MNVKTASPGISIAFAYPLSLKRHHRNLTLRELIMDGDYRTDLNVDQLPIDEVSCPISLESTNMHQPNDRVKPVYQVAFQKG